MELFETISFVAIGSYSKLSSCCLAITFFWISSFKSKTKGKDMAESAPFVSLESQEDTWDDDNSDEFQPSLQPTNIHYKRPASCPRPKLFLGLLIALLLVVILTQTILLALRKKTTQEVNSSFCHTTECVTASYGKWIIYSSRQLLNYYYC